MGTAMGREKRGRAMRKPQTPAREAHKNSSRIEPNTQLGASQKMPITLDSDDDALIKTPLR